MLSHGAIIARELGLPAAVNVANATLWLRTGDQVRLDGGTGTVTLLGRG
jgi:pyruvate,water dikinase